MGLKKTRVFIVAKAAIQNLLQDLDHGEGAHVLYRGYPNDDYIVSFDKPTNTPDTDDDCDNTGIEPLELPGGLWGATG